MRRVARREDKTHPGIGVDFSRKGCAEESYNSANVSTVAIYVIPPSAVTSQSVAKEMKYCLCVANQQMSMCCNFRRL